MKSIFTDREVRPTEASLKKVLGRTYVAWQTLAGFTYKAHKKATGEWKFSSEKYGWSFQIKDTKRVLVYLLPRDKFFKVGLVFGQKAVDEIVKSDIAAPLKKEILAAKVYAEGRGIRVEVTDDTMVADLQKLIQIKISM